MPLMPKRVKFRKSQKGRVRGNATRGNYVAFGEFGLQALEAGWISAETIEAGRIVASQSVKGGGKLYIRSSRTRASPPSRPRPAWARARANSNTGRPSSSRARSSSRSAACARRSARETLARVAHKMPVTCRFVTRRPTI